MIRKLGDIAHIITGYYKKPDSDGDVFYLNGKHFDKWGKLKEDAVLTKEILLDDKSKRHLLQDRDLLFIAKGDNNRACMYYKSYGKAIASSLFFVIRVDEKILVPEYLCWYFNTSSIQTKLEYMSKGTWIHSISKKALKQLEVYLPPIILQKQILTTNELWQKEKTLASQLINEKETYYETLLLNLAKNQKNEI